MGLFGYKAKELYSWLVSQKKILVLDVRNDKDFERFQVESPYPFKMLNISYYDFMELEEESVAKIPWNHPIRIVCAQEGSAQYVGEILVKHGFTDVGYLAGGIRTWGNLLVPTLINPGEAFQLYQFIRPGKASCSYGLVNDDEMMLFDPSRNVDFYLQFASEKNCTITATLETHLQADYIAGSRAISEQTGARFYANKNDFQGSRNKYEKINDKDIINFSKTGPEIQVLYTPGHTPGSTSYVVDKKFLISGDTVFIDSIGRPDLGGKAEEWALLLFDTMQKVINLDQNLLVLPGHYINWTEADKNLHFALNLAAIIERNNDIYGITSKKDFITFIKNNMRPQPEEYATIRMINANLEQVEEEQQETLDLGKNECAASTYAKTHG